MELTGRDLQALAELVAERVIKALGGNAGRWITFQEAMEYTRVKHPSTLRAWIRKGHIYGHKIKGGDWRVDRESIDDFFNQDRTR